MATEHTVAELARRARLSERTFARRFLAETGTTRIAGCPPSGCCTPASSWSKLS